MKTLLSELNEYTGDNVWEDVIYSSEEYDAKDTDKIEHGSSEYVVDVWRAVYKQTSKNEWRYIAEIEDYLKDEEL